MIYSETHLPLKEATGFKGLRNIAAIKSVKGKSLIPKMFNSKGQPCTDRQDIADIFAEFYQQLYAKREENKEGVDEPLSSNAETTPDYTRRA